MATPMQVPRAAIPPTTAPMMTPVGSLVEGGGEGEGGGGEGEGGGGEGEGGGGEGEGGNGALPGGYGGGAGQVETEPPSVRVNQ